MSSSRQTLSGLALFVIFVFGFLGQAAALSQEYCSSFNTADTNKNSSIYQTNGLCYNFCITNYAFAVVQYDGCWCSDYIPPTTTDGCDTQCPGFPDELCGGDGLYGYIALSKSPSGTGGASGPSSTSTSSAQSKSTTKESSTSTSTSTESKSSTWTPTPVISLETITGQVRTITVTPTVPPTVPNVNGVTREEDNNGGGGLSTGGAVGLTIGLVALVCVVCSIIYCCWKKRRQEKAEAYNDVSRRDSSTGLGGPIPSRTMSENSRYVLGTDGRQVVETWVNNDGNTPGSRKSRLMPVDPRLDPFAPVYQRGENKSRESVNTIRDDHDYSRRVHQQAPILRATNPDA